MGMTFAVINMSTPKHGLFGVHECDIEKHITCYAGCLGIARSIRHRF